MNVNEFAKEVHENAVEHGWWEDDRGFAEVVALCHSELSEALEEFRSGGGMRYYKCARNANVPFTCSGDCHKCNYGKPEGIAVELADCIIRILDFCGKENIDIEEVLREKHAFNKTRPYKHGGKVI